jgi:ketosteroid isomerase-like protein
MKIATRGWALAALLLLPMSVSAQPGPVTVLTPADYFQIYQLYATYSVGIDTNNAELRTSVFTPDGTMSSDAVSKHVPYGMAQMRKNMGTTLRGPRPLGGHVQANFNIVPTADGVDANAYVMLVPAKPDADGNFIGRPGFYTDRLVKTADGWRFKTREIFEGREFDDPVLAAKARALARPAEIAMSPLASPAGTTSLTPADFVAISQLYSTWSVAMDTGNAAAYVATYAPDGTYSDSLDGHQPQDMAAMRKAVNAFPRTGIAAGRYHIMMNLHVVPHGDTADSTCYAMIYDGHRDGQGWLVGDKAFYTDRLVKTAKGWRFKSRDMFLARVENPPQPAK